MNRNTLKLLLISFLTLILSGYLFYQGLRDEFSKKQIINPPANGVLGEQSRDQAGNMTAARVSRVVDGDTIAVELNGQDYKLRYIGINTPETVDPIRGVQCFGKEASLENKRLVEGKTVYLTKDVSETDRYGRLLRYVYLRLQDGSLLFVNDYLVRQGFAYADTFPPDVKYSAQFLSAQNEARENNRGLWASCPARQ